MVILLRYFYVLINGGGNMERKSDKVRRLVQEGEYNKALSIAKKFVLGITEQEQKEMVRAHECMEYPEFYKQIGIIPEEAIQKGIAVLLRLYGC